MADIIKAHNLKLPHGFGTRTGGVSTGYTESLNTGYGLGDSDSNVAENRRRFAIACGFDPSRTVWMKQIHSAKVVYTDKVPDEAPECDGLVTDIPGLALCVKTADCAPVLLFDAEARVIGAVHAGWRGTVAGVCAECIRLMVETGAAARRISAAIGPCIRSCCYEIDEPFEEAVRAAVGSELCGRFVKNGRADIAGLNAELMRLAGVNDIEILPHCTCCEPDRFFSHRFSKGKRGVMGSGICLMKTN